MLELNIEPIENKSKRSFEEVIPLTGESYIDATARVLKRRIGHPFNGGTVLDVGSRDGRFLDMIKDLGAQEVIAIEPDISEISEVDLQKLRSANLFNGSLEDFEKEGKKYDGAVILNCSPMANAKTMVESLHRQIRDGGTAVFSFAEKEPTYDSFLPMIRNNFREVNVNGAVGDKVWGPHKIIVTAVR